MQSNKKRWVRDASDYCTHNHTTHVAAMAFYLKKRIEGFTKNQTEVLTANVYGREINQF